MSAEESNGQSKGMAGRIIGLGAAAIALIPVWMGILEYRSAQKWKRAEFAAQQIDKLYTNDKVRTTARSSSTRGRSSTGS